MWFKVVDIFDCILLIYCIYILKDMLEYYVELFFVILKKNYKWFYWFFIFDLKQ